MKGAATKRPVGRPSRYSEKLAGAICERIRIGESLRSICRDDAMPSQSMVYRWLDGTPEFREQYARARQQQVEHFVDELLEIADNAMPATVQVAKLRIDARKWVASKLLPKKYGDYRGKDQESDAQKHLEAIIRRAHENHTGPILLGKSGG